MWISRKSPKLRGIVALMIAAVLPAVTPAAAAGPADAIARMRFVLPDGTTLTNGNLRGHVVLINFWASWCVPCRREIPLLNAYYRAHRGDGLVVIGVATDPNAGGRGQWVSPTIGYPQAAWVGGVDYRLIAVPTSYVIGRDGRLRHAKAGSFDAASLAELVTPLLKERAR